MKSNIILIGLLITQILTLHSQTPSSYDVNSSTNPQTGTQISAYGVDAKNQLGGYKCAALGFEALWGSNTYQCTAVGSQALYSVNNTFGPDVTGCTAVGHWALYSNVAGDYNTAMGSEALYSNNGGEFNTATGADALWSNQTAVYNTATGFKALYNNDVLGSADAEYNTAVGALAISDNSEGAYNTGIGSGALQTNSDGVKNTAVGYQALNQNCATGIGDENTAIGFQALLSNKNGDKNTAVGSFALSSNIDGYENTAVGMEAQFSNLDGYINLGVGLRALYDNEHGYGNVAVGAYAQEYSKGNANVAVGAQALNGASQGSDYNTAVGFTSLNYTGYLGDMEYNTVAGAYADVNDGANPMSYAGALGVYAVSTASRSIMLGNSIIGAIYGTPSSAWQTFSDGRFKSNVKEEGVKGIDFIMRLRPVVYNLDTKKLQGFRAKNIVDSIRQKHLSLNFEPSTAERRSGFIAQEVELAAKESGYDFNGVNIPKSENGNYSLAYGLFVVPLVKAVKEQQEQIGEQQKLIKDLKTESDLQDQQLLALNTTQGNYNTKTGLTDGVAPGKLFKLNAQPNPFKHETLIMYEIPTEIKTSVLVVRNLEGKEIVSLPLTEKGSSSVVLRSEKLVPGMYICSVIGDGHLMGSKRLIVSDK